MRRMITVFCSVVAFLASLLLLSPSAGAATAAYGCGGSLIDSYPMKRGSSTWGYVYLYYSTASNGTNCAVAVDTRFGTGTTKYMAISINRCVAGAQPGSWCNTDALDHDEGEFTTYAGPAKVTGTAARCVRFVGAMYNPAHTELARYEAWAVHCG
ncbi:hypothetical protein OG949_00515 [Streptomyces scopuliridis]|uniref:hypothetical protein n=1 Tax=Streptomyces scopuliridis TaxID=452529 RepID=UPI002DDAE3CE|nr:hypothetical protein [Streptomyces scopuliridis]WSB31513.1 hypothetical protein OG949_00515 [Streptomyces scopuliridis]